MCKQALLAEVKSLLGRAESTDKAEDDRNGDDFGDGLPKVKTAKERPALIRRAKAELEAQARERAREQEGALKQEGVRTVARLAHNLPKLYRHGLAGG